MARPNRNGGQTHHHKASQVRCAVYTRKSTEEGLDQDFNSLDAQREACEAFIRSQKSEGWALVPEAYDDGGISGGTLERPALQRLMTDIRAGRVDIVVVYKVDRLTRSLADFAKLVDTFDAAGASFVSVTQAFNTSTSMGRLTLNMLLSFAQFEREVTAERIRDKIAASKRKGMWMGGPVPLGYDVVDRKLVVNAAEAETVRHIYGRYLALGSIRDLKAELDRDGIVSKRRTSRAGVQTGAKPFSRGGLALILHNPLYIGEVCHKGERHPGQHAPIIDRDVWELVREKLDQQRVERRRATNASAPSPLAGLLFDHDGDPLSPSHASKGPARIRYRYYISHRLVTGRAADHPDAWRLPAGPVERAVRRLLVDLLRDRATASECLPQTLSAAQHGAAAKTLGDLATSGIDAGSASLRSSLIGLGARVVIAPDAITLSVSRLALAEKLGITADDADDVIARTRPFKLRKRGRETSIVIGDIDQADPDAALIGLVANGAAWARMFFEGSAGSLHVLARQLGVERTLLNRALPLAFLAPDITQAILDGRHPPGLTVTTLKRLDPFPVRWPDQRRALGFAEPAQSSRT